MAAITDEELLSDLQWRRERKNDYDGEEYTANLRAIRSIEQELARRGAARLNAPKPRAKPMTPETAQAITQWEREQGWTTD